MITYSELDKFIEQFQYLDRAASLINVDLQSSTNEEKNNSESNFVYSLRNNIPTHVAKIDKLNFDKFKNLVTKINKSFHPLKNPDISKVLLEIRTNLMILSNESSRGIHAKEILRKLLNIAPYLDILNRSEVLIKLSTLNIMQSKNAQNSSKYLLGEQERSYEFYSDYIVNMWALLEEFIDGFHVVLYSAGLSLQNLQKEIGGVIFRNVSAAYMKREGFNNIEINNAGADRGNDFHNFLENIYPGASDDLFNLIIKVFDETVPASIEKTIDENFLKKNITSCGNDENKTIIEEPDIRKLRNLFDGIIWKKEDVLDGEFLNYWRRRNTKKLPILPGKKSMFLYLYFGYLNAPNEDGTFKITHLDSEEIFPITDIKGKKSKISINSGGGIIVRKALGTPPYDIK